MILFDRTFPIAIDRIERVLWESLPAYGDDVTATFTNVMSDHTRSRRNLVHPLIPFECDICLQVERPQLTRLTICLLEGIDERDTSQLSIPSFHHIMGIESARDAIDEYLEDVCRNIDIYLASEQTKRKTKRENASTYRQIEMIAEAREKGRRIGMIPAKTKLIQDSGSDTRTVQSKAPRLFREWKNTTYIYSDEDYLFNTGDG